MSHLDIESLVQALNLDEKIQLISGIDFWHTAKIERLNIPSLRFSDGPNGVRGTKFFRGVPSACFPNGTALASSFDKELLEEAGQLMAIEAKSKGAHVILGPTCNIQRGPLGGRGFESYSPDPVLAGLSSARVIKGMQDQGIVATLKHYVCNDLDDERNSVNSVVTQRALREIYLLPFQLAIRDSNPRAIMSSYNKVNGEHTSQSNYLLNQILRQEWGWDGTIMSDWFGVYSLKESIDSGLDIEMPGPPIMRKSDSVAHAVTSKEIHLKTLDERVRNVLKLVKYSIENSGIAESAPESDSNNTPETSRKLKKIAADSIVLLKNNENLLPLSKDDSVAIIGPNAKTARYCGGGSASLLTYYVVDPFTGISSKLVTKPGYSIGTTIHKNLPELGQFLYTKDNEKAFSCKTYLDPPGTANRRFVESFNLQNSALTLFDYKNDKFINGKLFYMDFEGYYVPDEDGDYEFGLACLGTAQLFINDKLFIDNKTHQIAGSAALGCGTIEVKNSIKLNKGEKYKITVEFGSSPTYTLETNDAVASNGGGSLTFGINKIIDQYEEITKAVELAKNHDKVVLCIGTSLEYESEGFDRPDMELPGLQNELVEAVVRANPNVIVVNQSGTPVSFPWIDDVPCLLQAWFTGIETGNAIADVLFGDVNPSAKLSLTFPIRNQDNPAYFNFKSNNGQVLYGEDVYVDYRFYEKIDRPVLFPFGYGLSYTTFDLSNLKVWIQNEEIKVHLNVKNTGGFDGAEVIQVYIAPKSPSITRPVKELKDFTKVFLQKTEMKTVEINTSLKYAISYFDEYQNEWCAEKGEYEILVGNSSDNILLSEKFTIEKTQFWLGL
ncbi:hypothetical protein PACTADRAFT_48056 [Pachysolen tannophilus NRRL Y-2460]|uniref:beta-glucosidase n=1 Tax=Pachysolen tannophilus NRRL Y-2460 TaxID=669874 RepID=A0A1E4U2P6_PACTA|nr:hypothetical protein PACTADRAFT_48056 [Pachysolen tannophilus NRRL Y-2460]